LEGDQLAADANRAAEDIAGYRRDLVKCLCGRIEGTKVRFAMDSLLEEAVCCEPVSEVKFQESWEI
jgi:hypothetical protein